jgi:hypothetical protein
MIKISLREMPIESHPRAPAGLQAGLDRRKSARVETSRLNVYANFIRRK